MGADEIIGGVGITVSADFSDLDAQFQEAISKAVATGQSLAEALAGAAKEVDISGFVGSIEEADKYVQTLASDMASALGISLPAPDISAITGALEHVESSAGEVAQKLAEVGTAASGAAGGQDQFGAAAQRIVDSQQAANQALTTAQQALSEIQGAYERGAVDADTLARAAINVQGAFDKANPAIAQTKTAVDGAAESMSAMNQVLGALGISLGLAAFVHFAESIGEAADSLTKADIALTKITGDAEVAADILDRLDTLGISDGLSLPGLQKAATAMTAIVPVGTDVVGILGELADASMVSGKSIDALTSTFDRVAESGKLNARALKDFGLNVGDLKQTFSDLGISIDKFAGDAVKAFNSLDENDQIVVLQTALLKLQGTAQDVADNTLAGAWHKATAQFDADIALILKDMGGLDGKIPDITSAVNAIAVAFVAVGGVVKAVIDGIVNNIVILQVQLSGLGKAAGDYLTGNFKAASQDIADSLNLAGAVIKKAGEDWQSDIAAMKKTMADLENQVKTSAPVIIGQLDGVGRGAKDVADKLAAAAAQVKVFEDQIAAGGSAAQLQKDFENASQAINKLATADLPAAIKAVDDYTAAQIRNGAGAAVIMQAVTEEQKLINQLAKVDLPAAVDAMNSLVSKLAAAKEPLGIIQTAFEDEEKLINKLAKDDFPAADAAWQRLIRTLIDTNAPLVILNKALADHQKLVDDNSAALDKAVAAQIKYAEQVTRTALAFPPLSKAVSEVNAFLEKLGDDALTLAPKMDPVNKALADAGINAGKAKTAFQDLHTPIQVILTDFDNLAAKAKDTGEWTDYELALGSVDKRLQDLAKTDIPAAVSQFEALLQEMIKNGAPTDLVVGQLGKLEPILKKMSDEDLPGATQAWNKYLDLLKQVPAAIQSIQNSQEQQLEKDQLILQVMQKRGDAYGYILDQQAKVLQEDIHISEQTGTDANNEVLALEGVRLKLDALRTASHGWGDAQVSALNDALKGFDQLGKAMGQAIVDGENLGKVLVDQFKKIAASILGDLIQGALSPLKADLEKLISSTLPDLSNQFKVTAGNFDLVKDQAAAFADEMNATGATVVNVGSDMQAASASADTLAASSTGAGGAMTAMGTAASLAAIQLNTLITAIASVVGAIAAIVGAVYLAAIDTKLFHIETSLVAIQNDTANRRADAWDQFGQTYFRLGEMLDRLNHIMDSMAAIVASGGIDTGNSGQVGDDIHTMAGYLATLIVIERGIVGHFDTLDTDFNAGLQNIYGALLDIKTYVARIAANVETSNHYSQSMSESLAQSTQNASQQGHAIQQSIDALQQPIRGAGNITADSINRAAQAANQAASAQLSASLTVDGQLQALQEQYAFYGRLISEALRTGDVQLATQYQLAQQAIGRQISSIQEGINQSNTIAQEAYDSATANAHQTSGAISGASTTISTAVTNSGVMVSSAMNSAAQYIASAVQAAGASVSGPGTTTHPVIPTSGPGTGLSTRTTGVPDGQPGPYAGQPTNGVTGGYVPAPASGAATSSAQGTVVPGKVAYPNGNNPIFTPDTESTSVGTLPVFADGGYMQDSGIAHLEGGEYVLTKPQVETLVAALNEPIARPGKAQVMSNGGVNTPWVNPPQDQTPADTAKKQAEALQALKDQLALLQSYLSQAILNGAEVQAQEFRLQIAALTAKIEQQAPVSPAQAQANTDQITTAVAQVQQQVAAASAATPSATVSAAANPVSLVSGGGDSATARGVAAPAFNEGAYTPHMSPADKFAAGLFNPYTTPSFDSGGDVPADMVARLHAGEYVISPDLSAALRRMISTPNYALSYPTPTSGGTTSQSMQQTNNFYVQGTNAQDVVRQIAAHIKRVSPANAAHGN